MLIILDGINQLAERDNANAKLLNWLPAIKVIYSTLADDTTMTVFKRRGYNIFTLQPLDVEKREELIRTYLNTYSKSLLPERVTYNSMENYPKALEYLQKAEAAQRRGIMYPFF